jgi:hypothetical protein
LTPGGAPGNHGGAPGLFHRRFSMVIIAVVLLLAMALAGLIAVLFMSSD